MSDMTFQALRIEAQVTSVREDHRTRTDYLFPTKTAAAAVGCTPNKFADRWRRTRDWLTDLAIDCPGETAAEFMAILASADAKRQRLAEQQLRGRPS